MADERIKPIWCYVSPAGNNKIADWYEGLSVQEQADADEFIKNMRKTRIWKMPAYRPKLAGHDGIGELRWPSEKKQHRLVGYLKDGAYFALIGCTHKQQVYDPPDALDTADKRKSDIVEGRARTVPYDL
jgi:hypothetical protein